MKIKPILLLFVFCLVFLFLACQPKTEERLIGLWALELDSCFISDVSWYSKTCSNAVIIKQYQMCKLPILCGQRFEQSQGTWKLIDGGKMSDTVLFSVPDNPLQGQYAITFYKDYNEMKFKMKLQNDSTILICSKSVISLTSSPKDLLDRQ